MKHIKLATKNMLIVFSALMLVLISSCSSQEEPDKVTLQNSWYPSMELAGYYAADQNGNFADKNIEFAIIPGGPDIDSVAEVLAGKAQFGIGTGDAIISAQLAGQDVVAIASTYRLSPLIVMALPESDIQKPEDLVGKTVGVISTDFDNTWDIQFLAMLKNAGVDPQDVSFVNLEEYFGANDLLTGRMDAASAVYATNEAQQAKLDGYDVNQIFYTDYGVNIYPNLLFTTGELIRTNPDLIQRFVSAMLEGTHFAIENTDETLKFAAAYDITDIELQAQTLKAQIPLIDTGDAPIGFMDEAVWQDTQEILLEQGVISSPVDLNKVYTNEFVEKAK